MRFKILCICVLIFGFSHSQKKLSDIYKQSMEAHAQKDYVKFVGLTKEALTVHPSQPTFLYNLAAGYSLLDSTEHAFKALKKIMSWNAKLPYKEDVDFNNLLVLKTKLDSLEILVNTYNEYKKTSSTFVNLSNKRHLEDLVLVDSFLFLSDVYNGKLLKFDLKQNEIIFEKEFDAPVMALATDPISGTIWVSTADIAESRKKMAATALPKVFEIEPATGSIISVLTLSKGFVAGSMVFDKSGVLYITNSSKPEIAIFDLQNQEKHRILDIDGGFNLQGITIDLDDNRLYVSDYIKGLFSIDLKNNYEQIWYTSEDFLMKGIDGLAFIGKGRLLAIQNNACPKRVIKIHLAESKVESVVFLDNNLKFNGEPTNGKYYENLGFIYVANSQWPHYDMKGEALLQNWEEQKILKIDFNKLYK
ncbi:hypothetical protein [uncultured Croceitalea sp.]|uniref:YncE family protein n=1 Tax=uncultured Croceitalea sp. TaxID=1798908 RepID=UPI0033062DF6